MRNPFGTRSKSFWKVREHFLYRFLLFPPIGGSGVEWKVWHRSLYRYCLFICIVSSAGCLVITLAAIILQEWNLVLVVFLTSALMIVSTLLLYSQRERFEK